MNREEQQYLNILKNILENGEENIDRTGVGTKKIFGERMSFDLSSGKYPLLTTKQTYFKGIVVELIWLINGYTNIKYLLERDIHIWSEWPFDFYLKDTNQNKNFVRYSKEWKEKLKMFEKLILTDKNFASKYGELGPVYGKQWRNFNGEFIDQLKNVIEDIKNNPQSRRLLVSAWNPAKIKDMLLPPCHMMFQFNVSSDGEYLDLQMYQRSADYPLGVPFNIGSYSLLLLLIAQITRKKPRNFIHITGDSHIYLNQEEGIRKQIEREPYEFPELKIHKELNSLEDLENLEFEDFELINYNRHPSIKMPIAV